MTDPRTLPYCPPSRRTPRQRDLECLLRAHFRAPDDLATLGVLADWLEEGRIPGWQGVRDEWDRRTGKWDRCPRECPPDCGHDGCPMALWYQERWEFEHRTRHGAALPAVLYDLFERIRRIGGCDPDDTTA